MTTNWLLVLRRSSLFLFACTLALGAGFPSENERLAAASRLWVTVAFFHPHIAAKKVDWDSAFVSALPKIRAAATSEQYSIAIGAMLDALHDPCTHVLPVAGNVDCGDAPAQRSLMRTAFETAFISKPATAAVETVTLDLFVIKAIVRLSEPEAGLPLQAAKAVAPAAFDDAYPNTEARILAAAKTWGFIHYFFAYKDLMDDDWDEVYATYLPKFIAARDAREYNLTLCEMLTHLTDSHTTANSKTLDAFFGEASVGLRLRMLDKHPVVVQVLDPAATDAGVRPGDIIKHVGGESIVDRFNNQVQYVPASTPQRSSFDTLQRILNGPVGSKVTLEMEKPAGEKETVTLERSNAYESAPQRTGDTIRMLAGNIGYIDLDRLSPAEAESAMRRFENAKGIIFDLRGKAPAASAVAAHLAAHANIASALVTTPIALHPDVETDGVATQTASTFLVQTAPAPIAPAFKGKTVALIDERTIGEAEQAGLFFEAANKTAFVGTASAGANTEVATFSLPGAITVTYSARDIRQANGGKLQRLGLQPAPAPDTSKSIHDGKEEALETARTYLLR